MTAVVRERSAVEFGVLGPLRAVVGGVSTVLPAKQRTLLAALLIRANEAVPTDALIDVLWDDGPPAAARNTLQGHVKHLRRMLGKAGNRVVTRPPGYLVIAAEEELDLALFTAACDRGQSAAASGDWGAASRELRGALALWRGDALADVPSAGSWRGELAWLAESRLRAWESRIDADLRLGRHDELAGELRHLTGNHPLRERFWEQLMLALYRSGRQAEALDAYHRLAERLADDLGIDPGVEVMRLHEAILRQDPALRPALAQGTGQPPPERADPAVPLPQPAQLPLDVRGFTGRSHDLARLHDYVSPASGSDYGAGTMVILAIAGAPGIGKTALAVRFAYQVADRYPDGQLYVNLRGFDQSGSPVPPGAVLRGFLAALGVSADAIPAELEDRAGLYRSLLAGRRILVLLDNAREAAQVRPLLPGSAGCLVLVTSRSELTGLVAAEGARPLILDALPWDEARSLLASRLGQDRLDREPAAADEIVGLCGGLPLALVIVAARAATRQRLALADLTAELQNARSRLDALDTGDPATNVRTVFSWSYFQLGESAARTFRLLGLHPGPDITGPVAASAAAISLPQARNLLTDLARGNLLIEHTPGRYLFHDLVRAYASDLATAPDTPDNPRNALGRIFDYYLSNSAIAMNMLYPAEAHRRPRIPPPDMPAEDLHDAPTALAWLDAERAALVAVAAHAAASGWPGHAVQLCLILWRYIEERGDCAEGLAMHGQARDAARQMGDQHGEAHAVGGLGTTYIRLGSYKQAAEHFHRALTLFRSTEDRSGEASTLDNLAITEWQLGRPLEAVSHQEQAIALSRQIGDRAGETITLLNLADGLRRLGRYHEATAYLQQSLALARQEGDRNSEAYALTNSGDVEHSMGNPRRALDCYERAAVIFREMGHRWGEALVLTGFGAVHLGLREYDQAREFHQRALKIYRDLKDNGGMAIARNGLAEAATAAGHHSDAMAHHDAALTLALTTGDREQQARAHAGLGHARDAIGQAARARDHLLHALDLYTSLGYPEADKIRARLAKAGVG